MQITIRNRGVLRALGFTPSGKGDPVVGLPLRMWLSVCWNRIKQRFA